MSVIQEFRSHRPDLFLSGPHSRNDIDKLGYQRIGEDPINLWVMEAGSLNFFQMCPFFLTFKESGRIPQELHAMYLNAKCHLYDLNANYYPGMDILADR